MSEKEVKIRLNETTYKNLVNYCNEKNLSIRQCVEELITKVFNKEDIDVEHSKPILIVVRYPSKCIKCGKEVKTGDNALWVKGLGIICLECALPHDKSVLKKYLKIKELNIIKQQLDDELNKKYNELMSINVVIEHITITKELENMLVKLRGNINNYLNTQDFDNLKKDLDVTIEYLHNIDNKLNNLLLISKMLISKIQKKIMKKVEVKT